MGSLALLLFPTIDNHTAQDNQPTADGSSSGQPGDTSAANAAFRQQTLFQLLLNVITPLVIISHLEPATQEGDVVIIIRLKKHLNKIVSFYSCFLLTELVYPCRNIFLHVFFHALLPAPKLRERETCITRWHVFK